MADPEFTNGRGQGRGAAGAEGSRCGEGVSPLHWEGLWGEGDAPSPENFSISDLKMATLGAFWALFLQFTQAPRGGVWEVFFNFWF